MQGCYEVITIEIAGESKHYDIKGQEVKQDDKPENLLKASVKNLLIILLVSH